MYCYMHILVYTKIFVGMCLKTDTTAIKFLTGWLFFTYPKKQ